MHSHVVGKDKRCDSTFAYQQLMYDVSREIVHYTSRYVACLGYIYMEVSMPRPMEVSIAPLVCDGRLLEHSVFVN